MTSDAEPLIWVLEGAHAGDNAQAHALAAAVGGATVVKPLGFNGLYRIPNMALGATLGTLDAEARRTIAPPWPDLVIAAGRRTVPVALWIRRASGGRARLVQIGRPRAPLDQFDLVVTTPQYGLPQGANIVQLLLPVTGPAVQAGEAELARWRERLQALPRPWTALLVGGGRWPFRLDAGVAGSLARTASQRVRDSGGALLVSTSPRTGAAAGRALKAAIDAPAHVHLWGEGGDNPHRAFLALADDFIVTGESVSMLAEACRTGRPVRIADLPRMVPAMRLGGVFDGLARRGLVTPPRDVTLVHDRLVAGGHAAHLDQPAPASWQPVPDETAALTRCIRGLVRSSSSA